MRHTNRQSPVRAGAGDTAGLAAAAGALVFCAGVWLDGEVAGSLVAGHWPQVAPVAVIGIVAELPSHLSHPELAWPRGVRSTLPGPAVMYLVGAGILTLLLLCFVVIRGLVARSGRRHPAGAAPGRGAAWARRAELAPLRIRRRVGDRLVVGSVGSSLMPVRVATEANHSVLVIGPTQSGKTSGLAIPAMLDWAGPVVATSVKDDLVAATLWRRGRVGPCWVFDPTASTAISRRSRWSPLSASQTWGEAQRVAGWLVEATPARSGMADAAFWYAAAAKQLAPLLLAAARAGEGMDQIVRWTNAGEFEAPGRVLGLAGEVEAHEALAACAARDERIRSSVATTLETVLAPFEDPQVALSTAASDISCVDLLNRRGTVYLCGPSHEQQRVQGLFAALVSTLIDQAIKYVAASGRPLSPPLLLVLDEAANIAPIRDLDTLASTAAGLGIQLVTVCQDLAQLASRYGPDRSRTIANNHRAKVLLSGVSDLSTLDLVSGLAGETALRQHQTSHDLRDGRRTHSVVTVFRRLAPTDELRRIPPGEGVLIYGHLPPVRLRLRPWFKDRRLRRLVSPSAQPEIGLPPGSAPACPTPVTPAEFHYHESAGDQHRTGDQ